MSRFWPGLLSIALLTAVPAASDEPAEALNRIAASYQRSTEMAERLDYTVFLPDGREDLKGMEYGRASGRIFMALYDSEGSRLFHLTAGDGRLRISQFNVGGAYIDAPFEGSLAEALTAVGGDQVGLTVPPALAALESAERAFIESFGFNVLPGLEPATVASRDGMTVIELRAESGSVDVRALDAGDRLAEMSLEVGEAGTSVRVEGTFQPIKVPDEDPRWSLSIEGRQPVADFAELEEGAFPLGQPAAELDIRSLGGDTVSLSSLEGRVVILDFWATWCVPCWRALEHVEKVAAWAGESGKPVSVFAVDTLEQATTFEEQSSMVQKFLSGRGLELPVLIDVDDSFFAGMHSPGLPSTIVIGPDGKLAHFISGVNSDMESSLKTLALDLLESSE